MVTDYDCFYLKTKSILSSSSECSLSKEVSFMHKTANCNLLIFYYITGLYVMSKFGKQLLLLDKYTFYKQQAAPNNKHRWLCSSHSCKGCKAKVYTQGDMIVSAYNQHIHPPPRYAVINGQYIKM